MNEWRCGGLMTSCSWDLCLRLFRITGARNRRREKEIYLYNCSNERAYSVLSHAETSAQLARHKKEMDKHSFVVRVSVHSSCHLRAVFKHAIRRGPDPGFYFRGVSWWETSGANIVKLVSLSGTSSMGRTHAKLKWGRGSGYYSPLVPPLVMQKARWNELVICQWFLQGKHMVTYLDGDYFFPRFIPRHLTSPVQQSHIAASQCEIPLAKYLKNGVALNVWQSVALCVFAVRREIKILLQLMSLLGLLP